jgi:hypothetical protein
MIRFGWRGREEQPAALAERYLKTIENLAEALPNFFHPWHVLDVHARHEIPFADAKRSMTQVVENNVTRGEYGEPDPVYGYHILSANCLNTTPRTLRFQVDGGSGIYNEAWLEIGDTLTPSDPSMATFDLFEPAMLIIARQWSADWACAQLFTLDYDRVSSAPGIPPIPGSVFHIPWFGYLAAPFARGISLPPDLSARIISGGLLIVPMEERLDPTNPVHMRRASELLRIMREQTQGTRRTSR